jgi:3-keto-5-aminohexanoate cleavage enzyme
MEKVIVSAALTGAVTPKSANPNIPLTPDEIAEDAVRCWKAGAAVVHLHMRDDEARGTMDKDRFVKTAKLIRERCDVVVNCTTSGDNRASDDERMAHLEPVRPDIASFDSGSFNWMPAGVFMNSPQFLEKLAGKMKDLGVKPEIEIFDSGMIGVAGYYIAKGLIPGIPHYQLCLGVLGGADATVESLLYLRKMLPEGATWSAFGVGKAHLPILYATIALGGHVRVGLEDNIFFDKGVLTTNEALVQRAVRVIKEANKEPATPAEARAILGLGAAKA